MARPSAIRTVIAADFDNDGYEELLFNNIGDSNRLFRQVCLFSYCLSTKSLQPHSTFVSKFESANTERWHAKFWPYMFTVAYSLDLGWSRQLGRMWHWRRNRTEGFRNRRCRSRYWWGWSTRAAHVSCLLLLSRKQNCPHWLRVMILLATSLQEQAIWVTCPRFWPLVTNVESDSSIEAKVRESCSFFLNNS